MKWNRTDPDWTQDLINQLPYGSTTLSKDGAGEFFLQANDFFNCFDEFQISHDRGCQEFYSVWYDAINIDEN
jgi:hypothetical protein